MVFKVQPQSNRVLAGLIVLLSVIYALAGFNLADWRWTIYPLIGLTIGVLLLYETGAVSYLSASRMRHLSGNDFLRIVGGVFGGLIIAGSLLSVPIVGGLAPAALASFYGAFGGVTGSIAALLGIWFLLV